MSPPRGSAPRVAYRPSASTTGATAVVTIVAILVVGTASLLAIMRWGWDSDATTKDFPGFVAFLGLTGFAAGIWSARFPLWSRHQLDLLSRHGWVASRPLPIWTGLPSRVDLIAIVVSLLAATAAWPIVGGVLVLGLVLGRFVGTLTQWAIFGLRVPLAVTLAVLLLAPTAGVIATLGFVALVGVAGVVLLPIVRARLADQIATGWVRPRLSPIRGSSDVPPSQWLGRWVGGDPQIAVEIVRGWPWAGLAVSPSSLSPGRAWLGYGLLSAAGVFAMYAVILSEKSSRLPPEASVWWTDSARNRAMLGATSAAAFAGILASLILLTIAAVACENTSRRRAARWGQPIPRELLRASWPALVGVAAVWGLVAMPFVTPAIEAAMLAAAAGGSVALFSLAPRRRELSCVGPSDLRTRRFDGLPVRRQR